MKGIRHSKFMSIRSDAHSAPGDAFMECMNRAYTFIKALNAMKVDTNGDYREHLNAEIVKIHCDRVDYDGTREKWLATALIVTKGWERTYLAIP